MLSTQPKNKVLQPLEDRLVASLDLLNHLDTYIATVPFQIKTFWLEIVGYQLVNILRQEFPNIVANL